MFPRLGGVAFGSLDRSLHETFGMVLVLLVVFLVLAVGGGGWGHSRYGLAGWSPAGLILLVLVVLFFMGRLST